MKELILSKWDEILSILETEHGLSHIVVTTWIKPLTLYDIKDKTIYFTLSNEFDQRFIEFLKKKMYDIYLVTTIREVLQDDEINIIIELEENLKLPNKNKNTAPTDDHYKDAVIKSNLNPKYTFDTFIVGESNKLAHATCLAVAESPGQPNFNPLFIYGGPGLGKTHLIQSIAHYIIQNNRDMKVLYVPSEQFTNEIIDAIRDHKTDRFRDKYRNIDVLIIDDVQYLIGKENTQLEFFDTFNSLHAAGKQIILTSDKPPKEMKALEQRFLSRFEWGLPIDIHAPDYETRMAILKTKAEMDGLTGISEEVFQYIASNITYNVRELEGALNKLSVYSRLANINVQIDVDFAKDILKDLIDKNSNHPITPDLIINTVSEHLNISVDDMKSAKRVKEVANARQIAMYLCRKYTDKGLKTIGEYFGGKDHTTVISNVNKVKNKIETDPDFSNTVNVIIKKLNPEG